MAQKFQNFCLITHKIEYVSPGITEAVLNHVLIFAESLKDLVNKDLNQVNQLLTKRSNNETRNLSDLLNLVVDKAKNGEVMNKEGNFEYS